MRALANIFLRVWRGQWRALALGILLSVVTLAAGIALLGLSGWFITAAGMAGLAGAGFVFDVFAPSAGVRALAFGRAAARYGERLTTHDATLRGLAKLRVELLAAMLRQPVAALSRLRGSERLNHLTIDVDVLDGLALRLAIPAVAALLIFVAAYLLLAWLTTPLIAAFEIGSFVVGVAIAMLLTLRRTRRSSRLGQRAMQALRMRFIDMMRGQSELVVSGRLADWRQSVMDAHVRLQRAQDEIDAADHQSVFVIAAFTTLAAAGALLLGAQATLGGRLDAASAAIGFFAALALFEVAAPLARGIGELGRMIDAARRIDSQLETPLEVACCAARRGRRRRAASLLPACRLRRRRAGSVRWRVLCRRGRREHGAHRGERLGKDHAAQSGARTSRPAIGDDSHRRAACAVMARGGSVANRRLPAAAHGAGQRNDCG